MAFEDLNGGGASAFDPRMALMMIRNPEMVVQHLASLGHEPPEDLPEGGVRLADAGASLGKALSDSSPQFPPTNPEVAHPAPGEATGEWPGSSPAPRTYYGQAESTKEFEVSPEAEKRHRKGRAMAESRRNLFMGEPEPGGYPKLPDIPTPAPESAPATGAAPANASQETPGETASTTAEGVPLPQRRPSTADSSIEVTNGDGTKRSAPTDKAAAGGAAKKPDAVDDFARALMGLKAPQYQNPIHVSSPPPPRPSNMLARSTVPQTLMQEISALSHPATAFRLGEALRGKAYA